VWVRKARCGERKWSGGCLGRWGGWCEFDGGLSGAFYRREKGERAVSSGGQLTARAGKGVKRGVALACAIGFGVLQECPDAMGGIEVVWFKGGQARGLRWVSFSFRPCRVRGRETVQRSNGGGRLGGLGHAISTSGRLGQLCYSKGILCWLCMPSVRWNARKKFKFEFLKIFSLGNQYTW
jgi:hypothetical protein